MGTLFGSDDTWALWSIMLAGVAISIYLERTFRWAAKLSGPVLALLLAMTLSNLRIVPPSSPAYDVVWDYLVPVALPLLLFRANLFEIATSSRSMFLAFHISSLGTVLGAVLATVMLRNHMVAAEQSAGIMAASYIGGSVNFLAVTESLHVSENVTGPLIVADNFVMAGAFVSMLLIAGSRFFRRHFPHPHSTDSDAQASQAAAEHWRAKEISLLDIAAALSIAFAVAAVSHRLSGWIQAAVPWKFASSILSNRYLWITAITVTLATVFARPMQKINGAFELGTYLLYIFLFAIGLPADLLQVLLNVPIMFVFCLVIAVTNMATTLVVGKWLGIDLEELLLCVNATLGGAPSAAAMAISMGWSKLVLPAILVGIWGYAIGTFVGLLVAEMLQRLFA